jgi:hypothetical protein
VGRGLFAGDVAEPDAARHRADLPAPDGRPSARLDFHLGHAGGGQQLFALLRRTGLAEADTAVWGSPFDYERNALLYAPTGMPDPNSPMYQEAVAEAAWPAIRASGGRAFVLCTSLRAMRRIRELLQEKLAAEGLDLPLLMQGEGSRTNCWSASASSATPSWWPARVSGRAWMCAARRCRWW